EDQRYAERRDAWFRTRGWIVVHLSERYVLENTNGAIVLIQRLLADPSIAEELE
ncbi:MAG: hypothetical protein GWO24_14075, partial [Akkermansiaceae bacterium]|nr:hypothetical protein [Akkermansiaceae bacterium]